MPLFFFLYIEAIPGSPVYQTVPADDMQTDTPNLHVRNYHGKYHILWSRYM